MQEERLVVSSGVKFPVKLRTRKEREEHQTHGYEVDLIGASANRLVLATVNRTSVQGAYKLAKSPGKVAILDYTAY